MLFIVFSSVQCQPIASFPFNLDLLDKSLQGINVGVTEVKLTDLGTAFFNGQSNMNLWSFAGADWGNVLVIKFKFRFDFSNKFIDYGGLPVDLGIDLDSNVDLISQYHMTDMDWRLWNELRKVRTLQDWQNLLKEFGQSRTFYIFLGTLGFKPGTSNSLQVVRILGTPEAFAQFKILLDRMRPRMEEAGNSTSASGLRKIITLLKSMRGLINWKLIIQQLKGDNGETVSDVGTGTGAGGPGVTPSTSFGPGSTGGQVGNTCKTVLVNHTILYNCTVITTQDLLLLFSSHFGVFKLYIIIYIPNHRLSLLCTVICVRHTFTLPVSF